MQAYKIIKESFGRKTTTYAEFSGTTDLVEAIEMAITFDYGEPEGFSVQWSRFQTGSDTTRLATVYLDGAVLEFFSITTL